MAVISVLSYEDVPLRDVEGDVLIIGRRARLNDETLATALSVDPQTWTAILRRTDPGDHGKTATLWQGTRRIKIGVLPEHCSRHNSPSRAWAIPAMVRDAGSDRPLHIRLLVADHSHARAATMAAARGLPLYSRKGPVKERTVQIATLGPDGFIADEQVMAAIDGTRMAARLVDTPTDTLNTDAFVGEARAVAEDVGAQISVIQGEALDEQGFGGLWGVGKAATHLPAMVVLRWEPEGATRHVAWIGKGIVYDTGGLSIKSKTGMPGMKGDMGGAAAVLGAFQAAAKMKVGFRITAVLCIAENAVGPRSTRPDDILLMKSGKTVEVNNTDAEGRLVLADGVAWTCAETDADLLIDLATLTGAQLVSTGRIHAALYCNNEAVEQAAVKAGRAIGEPCHPLPYAPELFRKEFHSHVADMKNSVKDRANAQASCAGQFIGNHLPSPAPRWLHIDLAGPANSSDGRGTGYGVGLLLTIGAGPDPR
ncbi:MAG: leucyl aminopeptidase family protein [Myxococcota bacterium]